MDGTRERLDRESSRKLGAEVRRLRIDRGWSLATLAKESHYSVGYLSKIENGKKPIAPEMARNFDEVFGTGGFLTGLLPTRVPPILVRDELEPRDTGPCPYPGLVAFGPGESHWFFGRAQVTADLLRRLDERLGGGGPLAVVAPSGAGKSSLLAAGLIPALAEGALPGSPDWPVVTVTPGAHPLSTLAGRFAAVTGADPAAAAAAAGDPGRFAALLTEALASGKPGETSSSARVVLIVDQFEEIFTECQQESDRQAFITALCAAAGPAVLVVLGVRADFYGQCLAYPALLATVQAPVVLGPMSPDQLREIITRPAEAEGLEVEPGLAELLLRDLGVTDDRGAQPAGYDPGALPLLAHALRMTWQQCTDRVLSVAGYRSTGGIRQALASTAERAYTRLSPSEQRVAQQILLRLVNVREQGKDTRRRLLRTRLVEALSAPAPTVERVLEVLGRARLVTFDVEGNAGGDNDSVEITHEALLGAWPRLAGWLSADRAGLRTRQQLSEAAEAWEATGRDPSRLYRGTQLAITQDWAAGPNRKLTAVERDFLHAGIAAQRHEQQAIRRRTRRLRQLIAALTALLVLAIGASVLAVVAQRNAAYQRKLALSREVAAEATVADTPDTSLAMQLGLAAYRIAPTTQARSALLSASALHTATRELADTDALLSEAISPDGRILAVGSADQAVRLYDLSNPRAPTFLSILTGHTDPVRAVAFSPDGHILATASYETVRLWDTSDPHHPVPTAVLTGHTGTVEAVAFSPDGHTLASASSGSDATARLWDLTDPHHPTLAATLTGLTGAVHAVGFSPDGHTLATSDDSRTVQLWNLTNLHHPTFVATLTGYTSGIKAVAFSPDGRTLATASDDDTVRLWDTSDPRHPTALPTLTGHTDSVEAVAFSPDGHTLASAGYDKTVRLWDTSDPHHPSLVTTLTGHTGPIHAVTFSPDGRTVASASRDGTVRLWDTSDPHSPATILTDLTGPRYAGPADFNPFYAVAFSPDGHIVVAGNAEGTVRVWDTSDRHHPVPAALLTGHTDSVEAVAFSPDGHTLATASYDKTVRLWDLTDPHHPSLVAVLTGHTGPVEAVAFSPDGHTLATASYDKTVRLWDLTDPHHPTALPTLTGHTNFVKAVAFSPDGHTLATASYDKTVRLWDISDPHHPIPGDILTGYANGINAVAFSPDGHTLATGNFDHTVRLWDVSDPHHPIPATTLTGHNAGVRAVAFSPDGHTLATASLDDTIRLWDVSDPYRPAPVATLTGHTDSVSSVAFSPDGHTLATASLDDTIRLWDTDPDRAAQDICSLTKTTRITDDQWKQYFPDIPHQPAAGCTP
jgi:WD40 repeat protein/transcriptional regulator with XRE-family HTH domain